jgi:hypothetical protein
MDTSNTTFSLSRDHYVSIWKAPQKGKGKYQCNQGYWPEDFSEIGGDDRAYFAKEKSLAQEYARHYGEGVIEVKVLKAVYDNRLKQYEQLYQGGPRTELPIPHSEFDVLNSSEIIWHK